MTTNQTVDSPASQVGTEQIGVTAGIVWHTLHEHGRLSFSQLVKRVEAPRDLVMQAVGWLAREEKLAFDSTSRGRFVSLR